LVTFFCFFFLKTHFFYFCDYSYCTMSERDAAPADDPPGGSSAWRMSRKWIILVYQFHPLLHFPAIS
jgi:hypothetical protein